MPNEPQEEPQDIHYETDQEGAENASPKKAGFGKSEDDVVADLKAKLTEAIKEKQNYLDKWQRDKAEFLNARKRDQEDNDRFRKYASENLITELLTVLDSFNMAFSNKEAWEKVDKNWRTGVEYISNQLKGVLENNGLKELNPIGDKFDPMLHEAVEFKEVDDEKQNQKIVGVINVGYSFNGRVIKSPRVVVGEFKIK